MEIHFDSGTELGFVMQEANSRKSSLSTGVILHKCLGYIEYMKTNKMY